MHESAVSVYAFRLKPVEDLKEGIEKLVKEKNSKAGWVATAFGSLTDCTIRFANQPEGSKGIGHFEIVSLVGTVSVNGSHLHISLSDSTGQTIGGLLLPVCNVYTTAEIVLQTTDQYEFTREKMGPLPGRSYKLKTEKEGKQVNKSPSIRLINFASH